MQTAGSGNSQCGPQCERSDRYRGGSNGSHGHVIQATQVSCSDRGVQVSCARMLRKGRCYPWRCYPLGRVIIASLPAKKAPKTVGAGTKVARLALTAKSAVLKQWLAGRSPSLHL